MIFKFIYRGVNNYTSRYDINTHGSDSSFVTKVPIKMRYVRDEDTSVVYMTGIDQLL